MKLENRQKHESEFRRRLERVSRQQAKEMSELLSGKVEDEDFVAFWRDSEEEFENELRDALLIIWMTSALQHNLDVDVAMSLAPKWINKRASAVADSITSTSRNALEARLNTMPEDANIRDIIDRVWAGHRLDTLSKTEVTAVHSGAILAASEWFDENDKETFPDGTEVIWRLGPCFHCQACPLLESTEQEIWSRFAPWGPPIHPNCCCWLDIVPAFLLPTRSPPFYLIQQVMDDEGIKPWPAAA